MRKPKILVIESDVKVSEPVAGQLDKADYEVVTVPDGVAAMQYLNRAPELPHLALVGLTLLSRKNFELAIKIKSIGDIPLILLACHNADRETIVVAMRKYAEDFVVKPVSVGLSGLMARVQVVLARTPGFNFTDEPIIYVDNNLSIDFAHSRIVVGGNPIRLTPTESAMLYVLMRHRGRVVENGTLLARIWPAEEVYEDNLRVHVHRLRRKMEADSHHPHYIRTVRGIGYRFTQQPMGTVAEYS